MRCTEQPPYAKGPKLGYSSVASLPGSISFAVSGPELTTLT